MQEVVTGAEVPFAMLITTRSAVNTGMLHSWYKELPNVIN